MCSRCGDGGPKGTQCHYLSAWCELLPSTSPRNLTPHTQSGMVAESIINAEESTNDD